MNRTGKTNAAKGIEKKYNEYREFHEREIEAHICAAFMEMANMVTLDCKLNNYVLAWLRPSHGK